MITLQACPMRIDHFRPFVCSTFLYVLSVWLTNPHWIRMAGCAVAVKVSSHFLRVSDLIIFKWIIAFLTINHWFSFSINFLLILHYFSIINNFCSLYRNLLVFDKRILNNFGVFGLKNLREIVTLRPTKGGVTTLFIPLNHCLKTWRYEIALYRWFVVFFLCCI